MAARSGGLIGNLIVRWAGQVLSRRHARLARSTDRDAARWLRQARKLGRIARALEMDAALHDRPAELRTGALPPDTELLHVPSALRVDLSPSGVVEPASGVSLAADLSVHHDMTPPRLSLRQVAVRPGHRALRLDVWDVRGSFVSLALALPPEAVARVGRDDLVRLDYEIALEQPCDVFARLNLAHGPNTEQVVRKLDLRRRGDVIEFDVYYTAFDPSRAREIWIDLIFNIRPLNRVTIGDLTISRRPRLSL